MLRNYLKTIIRGISRNRAFTLINVCGLSLGLAAFIAITQYVRFETSYDSYHPGAEDVHRLGMDVNFGDGEWVIPFMGSPVAEVLKADFPEVIGSTRLYLGLRREYFVKYEDKEFKEKMMTRLYGDANFFEFFGVKLLQGNPEDVLNGPDLVVISESMAEKYFGLDWKGADIIGKSISMDEHPLLQISGVSEDVPDNTHFDYNFLISGISLPEWNDPFWFSNSIYHYLRMQPGTEMPGFLKKLNDRAPDYLNSDIEQFLGSTYTDFFTGDTKRFAFFHQPIGSIHLNSHYELELAENGDDTYVTIFSIVSVLILLMASINFMNLNTVSGLKRHKEVGVRKVLGSLRSHLIFQFLTESVLITIFSMVLAVTMLQILAPLINGTLGMEIVPPLAKLSGTLLWLMLGAIALGVLSGLYPAVLLSGLRASAVLKGFSSRRKGVGLFRNGLIIFQFTVSLLLIIGMTGIQKQMDYLRTRDLGYEKDQVMIIEDTNVLGDEAVTFRDRLAQNSLVASASVSGFVPIGSNEYGITGFKSLDKESDLTLRFRSAYVDEYYLETYGIELLSGRNFSADFGNEADKVIVNESFVKSWSLDNETVLGKRFEGVGDKREYSVVGVMKDFQAFSMKSRNEPMILTFASDNQAVSLQFVADNFTETRAMAEALWAEFTDKPFSYTMANARFEAIFTNEKQASQLFVLFAALAMIIGGLGLLGVASYVIVQRSKEVGIRKVLGASITQLFSTLSKDFMILILVAGVIAIPVAYYLLGDWLSQYAYQVGLSWWLFALPLIAVALIAFSITAIQIWKVALINPIRSLRYE